MRNLNINQLLIFSFLVISINQACIDEVSTEYTFSNESKINQRTSVNDSLFEYHNNFILWLFKNHKDSVYYYSDLEDFVDFVLRKDMEYVSLTAPFDAVEYVISSDTLLFPFPYYIVSQGFTKEHGIISASEYNSIYTVLDSVMNIAGGGASEIITQAIISRGKVRIDGNDFTNEDILMDALTQLSYSIHLSYELDDEPIPFYINPCILAAAYADVESFLYYRSKGDLAPGSPNMETAMRGIASNSIYAYRNCGTNPG